MGNDPVHRDEEDGQWYFWTESWADRHGPFDDEVAARDALKSYCKYLDEVVR